MSTQVSEAKMMVENLRVTELRFLLSAMGRSKGGRKTELILRITDLLHNDCRPDLLSNIRELYRLRCRDSRSYNRRSQLLHNDKEPFLDPESMLTPPTDCIDRLSQPHAVPAAEVQMMKLPFYHNLDTILPPTPLEAKNGDLLQVHRFALRLTKKQLEMLRAPQKSWQGLQGTQMVLRICYTESIGIEEDQYPANFSLSVNFSHCPIKLKYPCNKSGVEPRRPCEPINITPLVRMGSHLSNEIELTWGNFGKHYSVAVYLVGVFTAAELLKELQRTSVENVEHCRRRISEKLCCDSENEIATTKLQVSLICPLGKMRLSVPCRAVTCAHLQCFDAVFYLQMNEMKPTWTCPVCHKPAPFDQLRIDGLLSEVLQSSEKAVEEIEYLANGSWRSVTHVREREPSRAPDSSQQNRNKTSPAKLVTGAVGMQRDDVVDLTQGSSDEEDELTDETVTTQLRDSLEDPQCHHRRRTDKGERMRLRYCKSRGISRILSSQASRFLDRNLPWAKRAKLSRTPFNLILGHSVHGNYPGQQPGFNI
ncbi:E3 SUMO-protein ligase PIAS4b [Chanos chanos]|uniref:E3 SUMO-protein ligase PIAS4b n=1 Tax=Chanos chanos TaxID=29144 RepID=A0A6J2VC61_CHACN|nr:E3 SUMO-protein ligase PIAS4-A-like [Chanos chanos]